jgi:hypothetical protein
MSKSIFNFMKKIFVTIAFLLLSFNFINAQITQRERPAEWENLVFGGRFMDRFLPMPVMGELTFKTWGAKEVVPRYIDNGIEDSINSYWGGNVVKDKEGKYHLFVCGWPENSPKGHMFWSHSTVFHSVSSNSFGPYKVLDEIGPGHNPEIFQLADGRYVIYVIDACYISENLDGPWEKSQLTFNPRDRKIIEGLSNVTFTKREDGTFLAVCRGGGVWFSKTGISPYYQVSDKRIYPAVEGRFEDPLIWKTNVQYHLIVNDWLGRIAWYLRSKDGVNWKVDPGEAYMPGISVYEDGTHENWFKYERIKVLQDKYGRATQAHFAVIDTIKGEDLENDNHSSKHIVIPLTVGKLITVLNKKPITSETEFIELKIEAEDNFNPNTDIDLQSLRFGASEEVNFGRGCKVLKTKQAGDDLVVTFDAKGNGFTADNFAGKLIGKTTDGKLLFGYSRLPGVDYIESILSARKPIVEIINNQVHVKTEIQNFGQVDSGESELKIFVQLNQEDKLLAEGKIPKLAPFEKTEVPLKSLNNLEKNKTYEVKVILTHPGQKPVVFTTQLSF